MPDPQTLGIFYGVRDAKGQDIRDQRWWLVVADCPHMEADKLIQPGQDPPAGYAQLCLVGSDRYGACRALLNTNPGQAGTYGPETYASKTYPGESLDLAWGFPEPGQGAVHWNLHVKGRVFGAEVDAWLVRRGYMTRR